MITEKSDKLVSAFTKAFNINNSDNYQNILANASFEARKTGYLRNGNLNFGATQLQDMSGIDQDAFIWGGPSSSPIVGS
jgi:hypothetical protein